MHSYIYLLEAPEVVPWSLAEKLRWARSYVKIVPFWGLE